MKQVKRTEESNLEKKRNGLLVTGLMFASCLSLIFLEWASFEAIAATPLSYETEFIEVETPPIVFASAKKKAIKKRTTNTLIELVEELPNKEEEIPFELIELVEEEIEMGEELILDEDKIFIIVEERPQFPGGDKELMRYISRKIRYPEMAKDAGTQGTVSIQFIVNKDGSISNVQLAGSNGVTRKVGSGCDEEAMRVIKNMPKWSPGKQRGRPVNVQFTIPVSFKLN